jgi:hypothetical protein
MYLDDTQAVLDTDTLGRMDAGQQINVVSDLIAEQARCEKGLDLPYGPCRACWDEGGHSEVCAQRRSRYLHRVVEDMTWLLIGLEELPQLLKSVIRRCHRFSQTCRF